MMFFVSLTAFSGGFILRLYFKTLAARQLVEHFTKRGHIVHKVKKPSPPDMHEYGANRVVVYETVNGDVHEAFCRSAALTVKVLHDRTVRSREKEDAAIAALTAQFGPPPNPTTPTSPQLQEPSPQDALGRLAVAQKQAAQHPPNLASELDRLNRGQT